MSPGFNLELLQALYLPYPLGSKRVVFPYLKCNCLVVNSSVRVQDGTKDVFKFEVLRLGRTTTLLGQTIWSLCCVQNDCRGLSRRVTVPVRVAQVSPQLAQMVQKLVLQTGKENDVQKERCATEVQNRD